MVVLRIAGISRCAVRKVVGNGILFTAANPIATCPEFPRVPAGHRPVWVFYCKPESFLVT
jgi:hypothetical protein